MGAAPATDDRGEPKVTSLRTETEAMHKQVPPMRFCPSWSQRNLVLWRGRPL